MEMINEPSKAIDIWGFVQTWGALILSFVSIVFAFISLAKSSKAQKLQNKVNELELKIKQHEIEKLDKEKEAAKLACVEARMVKLGKNSFKLKVWNSGGNTAYNVTAKFEDNSEIIIMDKEKMPYEELESKKFFELTLILYYTPQLKARVLTEWDDEQGEHKSKSQLVSI